MDGQEKLLDYIRLILAGKSHEHIAIRKMLTFLSLITHLTLPTKRIV